MSSKLLVPDFFIYNVDLDPTRLAQLTTKILELCTWKMEPFNHCPWLMLDLPISQTQLNF